MNNARKDIILGKAFTTQVMRLHDIGLNDKDICEDLSKQFNKRLTAVNEEGLTRQDVYHCRTEGMYLPKDNAPKVDLKAAALTRKREVRRRNDWLTEESVKMLLDTNNEDLLDAYTALAHTAHETNDPVCVSLRSFRDILTVLTSNAHHEEITNTISALYQLLLAYMETAMGTVLLTKQERSAQFYNIYKLMLRDGFDGNQAVMLWNDYISSISSRVEDGVLVEDDEA